MTTYILSTTQARQNALQAVKDAPDGYMVKIEPRTRHSEQNAAYWALLGDISEQVRPDGVQYAPADWHELFKRRYLVPALKRLPNGKLIEMDRTTTGMTISQFSAYTTKVEAWAANAGVRREEPI